MCVCALKSNVKPFAFILQSRGQMDSARDFIGILKSQDLHGDKRYEVISSLRVALTNKTVRSV